MSKTKPLSQDDLKAIRIGHAAYLEARARAKARGLSEGEIEREADDDDSQFWEDVAAIGRSLRAQKGVN